MTQDKFTVYYNGKPNTVLNERLLTKQGVSKEGLERIKDLHQKRLFIEEEMSKTDSSVELKALNSIWKKLQFELQKAWGFPEDEMFHRFWEVPKCRCAVLDNIDSYPYPQYFNMSCPVHGE